MHVDSSTRQSQTTRLKHKRAQRRTAQRPTKAMHIAGALLLLASISPAHAAEAPPTPAPPTPAQAALINQKAKAFTGKVCSQDLRYVAVEVPALLADTFIKIIYDQVRTTTKEKGGKLVKQKLLQNPLGFEAQIDTNKGRQAYMGLMKMGKEYVTLACEL